MKISVDLDDVLGHYMQGFLDYYNAEHDMRHLRSDLTSYSLSLHLNEAESRIGSLVDEFALTQEYARLPVMSGAYLVLKKLKDQGHELSVLTSRKKECRFVTEDWVRQNYAGIFSDVAYTNGQSTKGAMAVKMGSQLHIDDAPKYAFDVAARGIDVLLFDQPWNKNVGFEDGIYRVKSFADVQNATQKVRHKISRVYYI